MHEILEVMRAAGEDGKTPGRHSVSGLTGGGALKLFAHAQQAASGPVVGMAIARALSAAESNACMGKIVAAPTAGACGILPAALLTLQEQRGYSDGQVVDALFTAAARGRSDCSAGQASRARKADARRNAGSAAAMAAAAVCELCGARPQAAADAAAFALMNSMGLVCDPVRGLVEVPCVYRNVSGVAIALTAADLALSGIRCPLEPDDVVDAMKAVGEQLPASLRETGEGGLCSLPRHMPGMGGTKGMKKILQRVKLNPYWKLLYYLPIHLAAFALIERITQGRVCWATDLPLDQMIPFCEWFVFFLFDLVPVYDLAGYILAFERTGDIPAIHAFGHFGVFHLHGRVFCVPELSTAAAGPCAAAKHCQCPRALFVCD